MKNIISYLDFLLKHLLEDVRNLLVVTASTLEGRHDDITKDEKVLARVGLESKTTVCDLISLNHHHYTANLTVDSCEHTRHTLLDQRRLSSRRVEYPWAVPKLS
jgi:hypothetical protein